MTVLRLRPTLYPVVNKYLKLWVHGPVYDEVEGEEGGNGTLRFSSGLVRVKKPI